MMRDYQKELAELKKGMKTELQISSQEFLAFRQIWMQDPERKNIVGDAQEHGEIIYRYEMQNNEKNEKK